jgi:hypothetical protein
MLTLRYGQGRVVPIYRGDLGRITIARQGSNPGWRSSGNKARIALGAEWDRDGIRSYFGQVCRRQWRGQSPRLNDNARVAILSAKLRLSPLC